MVVANDIVDNVRGLILQKNVCFAIGIRMQCSPEFGSNTGSPFNRGPYVG